MIFTKNITKKINKNKHKPNFKPTPNCNICLNSKRVI